MPDPADPTNFLKYKGTGTTSVGTGIATIGKSSGKWYWEVTLTSMQGSANPARVGIANYLPVPISSGPLGGQSCPTGSAYGIRAQSTRCAEGPCAGSPAIGTGCGAHANGTIFSIALDMTGTQVRFYKNGSLMGGSPITISAGTWYPACGGDGANGSATANFGQGGPSSFTYYNTINTALGGGYNPGVYT